jgi:hypothetical protein
MTAPTQTLALSLVEQVALDLSLDLDDIRADYYGRSMYGATCFGIVICAELVFPFLCELTLALAELDEPGAECARGLARAARTDSMGYDKVLYFPGWTLSTADDQPSRGPGSAATLPAAPEDDLSEDR